MVSRLFCGDTVNREIVSSLYLKSWDKRGKFQADSRDRLDFTSGLVKAVQNLNLEKERKF